MIDTTTPKQDGLDIFSKWREKIVLSEKYRRRNFHRKVIECTNTRAGFRGTHWKEEASPQYSRHTQKLTSLHVDVTKYSSRWRQHGGTHMWVNNITWDRDNQWKQKTCSNKNKNCNSPIKLSHTWDRILEVHTSNRSITFIRNTYIHGEQHEPSYTDEVQWCPPHKKLVLVNQYNLVYLRYLYNSGSVANMGRLSYQQQIQILWVDLVAVLWT